MSLTGNANAIIQQVFQNNSPYWDNGEYEIEQGYLELLFKPGTALQSRELTTLQSLLQFQISQLGSFDFQNGSPVQGGHITIDNSVLSLQIQANDAISLSEFNGVLIVNQVGAVNTQAVSITTDSSVASNTVEGALIVKYLSSREFPDGAQIQIATGLEQTALLVPSNATNQACIASINQGVFYVDGYFVYVPQQTIVLSSLTAFPTCRVGLQINPAIISSSQDSTLLDPAQGSFNYQAPGADRYQIQLTLAQRSLTSTDDSLFIELLRLVNGVIVSQIEYPVLGNIENSLAQQIYDIHGDFVVNPFLATGIDDPANANNVIVRVGAGKGFVDGYEFQTISPTELNLPKAQSTNTSNDYVLSLVQGTYVGVANLVSGNSASFQTANFGNVDLHYVNTGLINTSAVNAYAQTHIGTARVKDLEWAGTGLWYAYLADINVAPIVVNAASVSSNTTSFALPTTFPQVTNAFSNVVMTVLAGNSSGDVRTVVAYNQANRVCYLNRPTTQLLDTSSQISLAFGIKDVKGFIEAPASVTGGNVCYNQNTTTPFYAAMDVAFNGGQDQQGNTVLFDSAQESLIFPLPQSYIAQNTFSSVSFLARKVIANLQFTSGNATISAGAGLDTGTEQFTFGLTNSYLSNLLANENFIVMVRNSQTGNIANGQLINWDHDQNPTGNGVFQGSATSVTLKTVTTGNFLGDVYFTVQDTQASTTYRRTKSLVGNSAVTALRPTDGYQVGTVAVIGTANANTVWIDATNGFIWMNSWPDIQKTPGISMSLYVPDMINLVKVFDSGNPNFAPNSTNAIDITNNYLYNGGQTDNYYNHAGLILIPGNNPPQGQVAIMLQYYSHSATLGFFDADSYSASDYANNQIPVYTSHAIPAVNLRDVIDFRPTRTIGSSQNVQTFALSGLKLPYEAGAMTTSYAYYLPRIDKLVLTKQRQFAVVPGTPALQPAAPPDQAGSMTLYVMTVPQYTFVASNVSFNYVEHKRYTMADIGALDARISQLEYEVSLSQLETQALQQSVMYQGSTVAKEQFGVVTDAFLDFSVADITNPDLIIKIAQGQCTPYVQATPIQLQFVSNTGPAELNDYTYSLAYSETPILIQNTASDQTQIQPYAFGQFQGSASLYPASDFFYSDDIMPQVIGPPLIPVVLTPIKPLVPNTTPTTANNTANVSPKIVNKTPPTPSPKPTGLTTAAPAKVKVCWFNDLWFNRYDFYGNQYRWCYGIDRTPSGYGYVAYQNGSWYLNAFSSINRAASVASQSQGNYSTPGSGSVIFGI